MDSSTITKVPRIHFREQSAKRKSKVIVSDAVIRFSLNVSNSFDLLKTLGFTSRAISYRL